MFSVRHVQSGTSSFYGFDPVGNTRLLASPAGAVTDRYRYKAFGEEVSSSGSTANPHRYGGQVGYYRDKIERVYVRARHYTPTTGRWLSRDPNGRGGDFNLYRYVINNPIRFFDVSGMDYCTHNPPPPGVPILEFGNPTGGWYRSSTGMYCHHVVPPRHEDPPTTSNEGFYCGWRARPGGPKGDRMGTPIESPDRSKPISFPPGHAVPVDCINWACWEHDQCIATPAHALVPFQRRCCDAELIRKASECIASGCNTAGSPSEQFRCRTEAQNVKAFIQFFGTGGADVWLPALNPVFIPW